nr:hypothetical protein [Kibdelosporangium sp. MJ126-NF4]
MSGLLVSGCGGPQTKDLAVPDEFQRLVRGVAVGAQPTFTGSTCVFAPREGKSYRYRAEYTVPAPLDEATEQVRRTGADRGWQLFRSKQGAFLMTHKLELGEVIIGLAADGGNTKVSAVNAFNCGHPDRPDDPFPDDPLYQAKRDAEPQ